MAGPPNPNSLAVVLNVLNVLSLNLALDVNDYRQRTTPCSMPLCAPQALSVRRAESERQVHVRKRRR